MRNTQGTYRRSAFYSRIHILERTILIVSLVLVSKNGVQAFDRASLLPRRRRRSAVRATCKFHSCSLKDPKSDMLQRVKNNRRVNNIKAEAIRLGREHLGEKGQGKGRPTLKSITRGHAQMDDSQDDGDLGEEPLIDGEIDGSPRVPRPKCARPKPRNPKKPKLVSRSKHRLVNRVMVNTSHSQSANSSQHQGHSSSPQASYLPQAHILEDPFTTGPHLNGYIPAQQAQTYSDYGRMMHGLAENQKRPTPNQYDAFQPSNTYGSVFHGDNSTGGSESEGLGGTHF